MHLFYSSCFVLPLSSCSVPSCTSCTENSSKQWSVHAILSHKFISIWFYYIFHILIHAFRQSKNIETITTGFNDYRTMAWIEAEMKVSLVRRMQYKRQYFCSYYIYIWMGRALYQPAALCYLYQPGMPLPWSQTHTYKHYAIDSILPYMALRQNHYQ